MEIKNYLKNMATSFPKYILTDKDKKITDDNKAEWITRMILKKKFRKTKVFEDNKQDILKKVKLSIEQNKPLHFIILFGGYKHFWNSSYPEVDWAELFNLNFMSELFAPILQVHKPGVILEYGSEDLIITLMDNYPEKDLNKYAESFGKLLELYSKCIPDNFKIRYVRTGTMYDSKKLKEKVKKLISEKKVEWEKLSDEIKAKQLHRSPRSIMWKGQEDWSNLSESEKQEKIKESKIVEDTFYEVEAEFLGDYFTGDNHIPLVLSWGLNLDENIDHWLTLGSTHSSTVDFWIGRGILEDRGNKFVPRVVSKTQYEKIKSKLQKINIDLIPLKNLKSIEVYPGSIIF